MLRGRNDSLAGHLLSFQNFPFTSFDQALQFQWKQAFWFNRKVITLKSNFFYQEIKENELV